MKITILLSVLLVAVLTAGIIIASEFIRCQMPSNDSVTRSHPQKTQTARPRSRGGERRRDLRPRRRGRPKRGDPTPMTTNDVFHIGSCTKSMTATLAAMLIDEGKLRWDTTIADIFPELKGRMDKQYETVTVEQLLHSSRRRSRCAASRRMEAGVGRTWHARRSSAVNSSRPCSASRRKPRRERR